MHELLLYDFTQHNWTVVADLLIQVLGPNVFTGLEIVMLDKFWIKSRATEKVMR